MTTTARQPEPSTLLRADGSVVVPPDVAAEVLRALIRDTTARIRADGGHVSTGLRTLLYALHNAADTPPAPAGRSGTGSGPATPRTVVTVTQAAALLECTPRWVRYLIKAGRLDATRPGGGCWLIDQTSLDTYRKGTHGRPI